MKKTITAVLLIFIMCCSPAYSELNTTNLILTSYHFDSLDGYNDENFGISFEFGTDESYWIVGGYDNSYYDTSLFAGHGNRLYTTPKVDYGVEYGLITGYTGQRIDFDDGTYLQSHDSPFMVVMYAKIGERVKVNLSVGFIGLQGSF